MCPSICLFRRKKLLLLDAHFHPLSLANSTPNSTNDCATHLNSIIKGVGASACPQEWETLRKWSCRYKQPFILGLHPWLAEVLATDPQGETKLKSYLSSLDQKLRSFPYPCAVGEIGFDKVHSRQPNFVWQNKLFTAQYRLAQKYSLPIVIHCVKSYGHLFDALSELSCQLKEPQPQGLIHAFWGTPELALRLIKLNFYISLNSKLLMKISSSTANTEKQKLAALAKVIPLTKLLLESDAPWGVSSSASLRELSYFLAPYWSASAKQLQEICHSNLHIFYNLPADTE